MLKVIVVDGWAEGVPVVQAEQDVCDERGHLWHDPGVETGPVLLDDCSRLPLAVCPLRPDGLRILLNVKLEVLTLDGCCWCVWLLRGLECVPGA